MMQKIDSGINQNSEPAESMTGARQEVKKIILAGWRKSI